MNDRARAIWMLADLSTLSIVIENKAIMAEVTRRMYAIECGEDDSLIGQVKSQKELIKEFIHLKDLPVVDKSPKDDCKKEIDNDEKFIWNEAQTNRLNELIAEGHSHTNIAKILSEEFKEDAITTNRVTARAGYLRNKPEPNLKRWTPRKDLLLEELAYCGVSIDSICFALDMEKTQVHYRLRYKSIRYNGKKGVAIKDDIIKKIMEMRAQGKSIKFIAIELNVNINTVGSIVRRNK